ncbi:MAG: hypothetical protein EPN17_09845 [Methylobacter sp.]|nr:MAG: hypothetical protein EPN17_09845 [Methylobacter sp.]
MNISPFSSSYAVKTAASDGNLHSAATSAIKTSAGPNAVVTLSSKALELMQVRQVSDEAAQQFKDILAKANTSNAQAAPKAFLNGLSPTEMETLRQVHSLGDSINVSSISNEGATNLLVQPGSEQDLDNNGLTSVGAANGFTFPPRNAPESFKAAWASASEGMSFKDIPTHMIFAVGLANIHYDPSTGKTTTVEPGDPNWRNPYADPGYDYKGAVSSIMSSLEYQHTHNMMSHEKYRNDMNFYTRLSKRMG